MLHLMIGYHVPKNEDRHKEYLQCLEDNLNNQYIEKVHIFLESNRKRPPIDNPKIVYAKVPPKTFADQKKANIGEFDKSYLSKKESKLVTFADFFRYARENLHGERCIIANSDIFFGDAIGVISDEKLGNTMLCLTRWDILDCTNGESTKFFNRSDSQDAWIFESPMKKEVEEQAGFFLGKMGCDNKIAFLAFNAGLKLTNPAHQIQAFHRHKVDYRTYLESEAVDGVRDGDFVKVHPTDDWELSRVGNVAEFYTEYR